MTQDNTLIAKRLGLDPAQVTATAELLDGGNTIPFIARFRKDQTGGLDAGQIQGVKQALTAARALAERKTFVLKSIESQGGLTPELEASIRGATAPRHVEDLYLPFKPRKQSLALTARQQGLEPLSDDILNGRLTTEELAARAKDLVRVDKGLTSADDVMNGVGHLIAEAFADRGELWHELRKTVWHTGKLVCRLVQEPAPVASETTAEPVAAVEPQTTTSESTTLEAATTETVSTETVTPEANPETDAIEQPVADTSPVVVKTPVVVEVSALAEEPVVTQVPCVPEETIVSAEPVDANELVAADATPEQGTDVATEPISGSEAVTRAFLAAVDTMRPAAITVKKKSKKKKKPKKKEAENPFADFENFEQPLNNVPHHRILAINRGEKANKVRVRVRPDLEPIEKQAIARLVPADNPCAELLQSYVRDALNRYILPSLEREVRRELTEMAESHAVEVFANNLKALLMQPPVRGKKILAIDPGYKSGCSVAIVDPQGAFLAADRVFVVGNQQRRDENRKKLAELVTQHEIGIVAIGNGAACRQVEQMVSDAIAGELAGTDLRYVVVNEAGASIYSTSEIGKEELPVLLPGTRSAVSIARRLIDPLSELVKINPCHLGIGLYQHDIKARHLADSLDEVVMQCVNAVGVNVNTASPSLLRYVSGLNQLTARRLYEFRQEKRVTNREMIREVAGIGDATFVQAAGFLRVFGGDAPLDETGIHPESYPIALKLLEKIGTSTDQWSGRNPPPPVVVEPAQPATVPTAEAEQATAGNPPAPVLPVVVPVETATGITDANHSRVGGMALAKLDPIALAAEFDVGALMMRDIIDNLRRPGRDPRSASDMPVFRSGILGFDDLKPEMQLHAQVVNVVDFGVFVDVGLGHTCLVHVSELSRNYIQDLHHKFAVGDVLITWVQEIDAGKRRVKLTALPPGTKRFDRRSRRGDGHHDSSQLNETRPADNRSQDRPPQRSSERSNERSPDRPRRDQHQSGDRGQGGRRDSRPHRGQHSQNRDRDQRSFERKPAKPKFVKPIEDDMLKGEKPMRSFSDLAQFYKKKDDSE